MGLTSALVTLALLASARGGPISSLWDNDGSQCATKCTDSRKFKYSPGSVYQFDYTTSTATSMEDASEETARLLVTATAHVHVITNCEMVLQLRDIKIQESDPNGQGMRTAPNSNMAAARLEMKPLRFSFQDGVVDSLCPAENEDQWALNVKRGFLSAFQNGMNKLDADQTIVETDVAGRCPSEYRVVEKGWYTTTVKRSKDLLACTDRHDYQTALTSSPYHVKSSVQSLPLMKSSHECEQSVDQYGILTSATCEERHLFRPFSREASGALTKVSQTLKFKGKTSGRVDLPTVGERVSMLYDHISQEEQSRQAAMEAEKVLRDLCRNTQEDIRPDTPRLFANLVSVMRKIDVSGLRGLYSQLEQNTLCAKNIRTKKFFIDALPMVGTEATVSMMTSMLEGGDVIGMEADMWLTSFALIQEPTSAMLQTVTRLVKNKQLSEKATMPISTMIHHFCLISDDCSEDMAVKDIMDTFEGLVGSSCFANKKNLQDVILGLRAIGNAGHVSSSLRVVNKCLARSKNDVEVRVAAAQAFRRMPCDNNRDSALAVYEDMSEDSEVRIASYLAFIPCVAEDTLQRVQRVLERETDEQVGSFVWSHLTNLQETSSPHKQAVRKMLEDVKLPEKFNLGRLQFSRNYEGSLFVKRFNTGAGAEANLIFSPSSSLPRSASANLTVDLFGKSLNLMEVGGRLEGLEYLVETLLGPYGYFGESSQEDIKKSRAKLDELKGSMYMRLLGNEMTYQRFQGIDALTSGNTFNMLDFLIKLSKDHDISLTHSMVLMDSSLIIPTSSGLPLTLTVNGTATVDLRASGKMDLRKVSAKPRSLQIDGEIRPSGSVRVEGTMSVDAMVTRSALRVTGTLHSSSVIRGHVDLDRGRVLSVELDVPQDKMEVLDIRSEFAIVHNTVEKEQKMITDNRRSIELCTGKAAADIVGLELCGELQYPNASTSDKGPYFPLTGPTSLTIALYKRDTHTSYKLLAKRVENKKKTMAQLSFNTPGSQVDRAMAFDLVIDHEDKQLEVSVASPWKKAEFKAAITHNKQLVGVSGSFVTDDVNVYAVTSEVKMTESKSGLTYSPRLEIRRPGSENVALTGTVSLEGRKSASVELALSGVAENPLTFKSAMINTNKEMSLSGAVSNGDKNEYSARIGTQMNIMSTKKASKVQLNPFLSVKTPRAQLIAVDGSANYVQGKVIKGDLQVAVFKAKPASIVFSHVISERKAAVRYIYNVNVKSSFITTKMATTVNVKKGRLINGRSTLTYAIPKVARDKLVLMAKLSDRSTKAYNKYTVRSSLDSKSFPDYNTAVKVNVDHKKKLSSGEVEVKYGKNPKDKTKRVFVAGTVVRKIKNLKNMDLNYKMEVEAPAHDIAMNLKGKHSHSPVSLDSNVALTYAKGKDASASLTLRDKSSKLTNMNGVLTLQAPIGGLTLKSDLSQKSGKQWEHNVLLKTDNSKHSLTTMYKTPEGDAHDVTSTLNLQGLRPITLSGQAKTDWRDMQMGGSVKYGKALYGVTGTQKLSKSHGGKWSLEAQYPDRRVTLALEGGKNKGAYEGSVEAAWDADNDKKAKITLDGLLSSRSANSGSSHTARVRLFTPFEPVDNVVVSFGLDRSDSQYELSTKMTLGGKKNSLTSSLVVATPLTPQRAQITWMADTPFKGYGKLAMTLDHTFDNGLNTKLTTSVNKDNCELTITAQNRGTSSSRDLQGAVIVKSSWRRIRDVAITAMHKDDGSKFDNSISADVNGDKYAYVMTMTLGSGSSNGEVMLTWPEDKLSGKWSHRHTYNDLSHSTTWEWGHNQRAHFDVTGRHLLGSLRAVSGTMNLDTPWTRDWRAEVNHEHGNGKVTSTSSVKSGKEEAFSHSLTARADASKSELEFQMTSAWNEPISSKLNARYDNFPMSANAEFSWDPRKKVTADGSVIVNNWDDLDMNLRVTTPIRGWRSMEAKVSSKAEGSEVVSHVTFDYGVRQTLDLETRVQRDLSSARARLRTPFDDVRVIEGGMTVQPDLQDFSARADFKAMPALGKYEGSLTWTNRDDFSARLRLDTPHPEFPYLQVITSSQDKQGARNSHVELELSPSDVYSLDAAYSLNIPYLMDLSVRTPIPGYDSLGATFKHSNNDYSIVSSAEVTYASDKTMKTGLTIDWSRGLDSALTVTTPFDGWRDNSATIRHEGDMNDFNCFADVSVAGTGVTGNLKFFNKAKTEAQLSISTPWAGFEKIEAGLTKKGDLDNMRGSAMLVYGPNKMEATLNHKWNSRRLRTVANLKTPYTEDIHVKVEHSGEISNFQSEAEASYGRDYSADGSVTFNLNNDDASGSAYMKYRLGGPKTELAAAFGKTGPLDDLALTGSVRMDKDEISATASLNTRRDVRASIAVRTPFQDFESLSASVDTSGLSGEASVQYMTGQVITAKLETNFQGMQQMSVRGTLTSPIQGLERTVVSLSNSYGAKICTGSFDLDTTVGSMGTVSASYKRTGPLSDMKAEAKVSHNGRSLMDTNLMFELADTRLATSYRMTSTFTPEVNSEVNFSGIPSDFQLNSVFSLGADKVSTDLTFSSKGDKLVYTQNFGATYNGDNNRASASFSKIGPMDDVTVTAAGHLNNEKVKVTGKLNTVRDMSASLEVKTPFEGYRKMEANVKKMGDLSDLTAIAAASLEQDKVEVTGKFAMEDLSGSLAITTPFRGYRDMATSFRYTGDLSDMTLTAAGSIQNEKIEATAKFTTLKGISGSIDISTPFTGYRHMGSSFTYSGDLTDLSAMATGNVEDDRVEVTGKFSQASDVSGSLTVHTPFTGFTDMGSSFSFSGDLSDMTLVASSNVMSDKVEATAKFTTKNDISGSVDVTTPFDGFRKVGANFQHSGSADNFRSQGAVTYMDGQEISGQLNFYNYRLRRLDVSGELKMPFQHWESTRFNYKHAGNPDKFECNAELECSQGHKSSMNLKVDVRNDQSIELTVDTPYDGFRHTRLTHSLALADSNVQWTGSLDYGQGQRVESQMSAGWPTEHMTFHFEARSPFTSDLLVDYDRQGPWTSSTEKYMVNYGDNYKFAQETVMKAADNFLSFRTQHNIVWDSFATNRFLSFKREGAWNDVKMEAKGEVDGEEVTGEMTFKNEFGRIESAIKINTPKEGFNDIGMSFQHYGQLTSAFNTEVKVEYMDDEEVMAKVDFMRVAWQRLEMTAQLTTPFEGFTQSSAELRYSLNNDGLTSYAAVEYEGNQRLTADLRLMTSPNPEVTLTFKTPFTNWEQMSATGSYQADDWGKKEASAQLDLGRGMTYTITTDISTVDTAPYSATLRLTTPHADWHTLEARLTQEGVATNFKTSAFLTTPLTNEMRAGASFRYNTPFDMDATATFESAFENFRDLKFEMMNTDSRESKTSHVLIGWAQGEDIVMDGTWRHQAGWYDNRFHADMTLTGLPFEQLRSASWMYESQTTQARVEAKAEASLNGEKYVDGDLAYTLGDLPEMTLTVREPRPMLYTASRTSDGAELFMDWDRNDPSCNLRVTSRLLASSDSSQTQHDMEVKLIHPSRTMGAKYNLLSTSGSTTSQGELSWGRGDNQRFSYNLDLNDRSRRSVTSYEGKFKVGIMQRALELNGAWSDTRVTREMDAAFSWDADRDQNKQVGLKTKWTTSGAKNKADVTISLPSIAQEVRVESEVAVNQGQILLDATTALSYSPDARKTLTLTSKLQDTTSAWASGSNYSLHLALTHPYTDLDLGMTSHLGAKEDRYSAGIDTWYVTSRREKKNMALRGEIDRLRQQISMEMVSPVKKISLTSKVQSEPYSISIRNAYDDDRRINADITLDTSNRVFTMKTNYDLDNPERTLVVKAMYVNDSAIKAEVYRDHVTERVTDAMMTARLNTSTLLHSRLHWRPASLSELQDYAMYKLATYGARSKATVHQITEAVGEELSERYRRTASALAEDVTPLLQLVEGELASLGQELTRLRRQLNRAYRRNDFYLQDMGEGVAEYYNALQEYLSAASDRYQEAISQFSRQMSESLQMMTQFPVREEYMAAVGEFKQGFEEMVDSAVAQLIQTVADIDNYLQEVRQNSINMRDNIAARIQNTTFVQRLQYYRNNMNLGSYIDSLPTISIPEQYTAPIYAASDRMSNVIQQAMQREELRRFGEAANEVYQQGVWAYNYWQVEENLKKHLISIAHLMKEIAADEMQVYTAHFRFLKDSRVTVWDPENGELQVEVSLPFEMESLDSLPNVTPIIREYNKAVNNYIPDTQTIKDLYDNYGPQTWWPENSTAPAGEVLDELKTFEPEVRPKFVKNRKYYRNRGPVVAAA